VLTTEGFKDQKYVIGKWTSRVLNRTPVVFSTFISAPVIDYLQLKTELI
jgi:hypothetical protein